MPSTAPSPTVTPGPTNASAAIPAPCAEYDRARLQLEVRIGDVVRARTDMGTKAITLPSTISLYNRWLCSQQTGNRVSKIEVTDIIPADERHGASFSLANKAFRILWSIAWLLLARFTPPPFHAWRCTVLRLFGARIGAKVRVYGSCRIWNPRNLTIGNGAVIGRSVNCYNQGSITIGRDVVVSQDVSLCASTHNVEDRAFPLLTRPIVIEDDAWIAAESFVGPGVVVGQGAVLGARAVAMRRLDAWTYYTGNPARALKPRPRFPD